VSFGRLFWHLQGRKTNGLGPGRNYEVALSASRGNDLTDPRRWKADPYTGSGWSLKAGRARCPIAQPSRRAYMDQESMSMNGKRNIVVTRLPGDATINAQQERRASTGVPDTRRFREDVPIRPHSRCGKTHSECPNAVLFPRSDRSTGSRAHTAAGWRRIRRKAGRIP